MQLTSTAFAENGPIPIKYTCDGEGISPPLSISGFPEATRTLVLLVDDPDASRGTYDHWVAYDIPVTMAIPEGVTTLGTAGRNSSGATGYQPPCPPSGTHRYFFTVYAMSEPLGLGPAATKPEVLDAIEGRTLEEATLIGRYGR
jgi:Raf kinase inhibitor-like YbhB/YbcL family protein